MNLILLHDHELNNGEVASHREGNQVSSQHQSRKRLQGAADARHRPVSYTSVCEQADNKADAVPCDRLRGEVVLRDHRADHIRTILKATAGDQLRVGVVDGPLGQGVVRELSRRQVILDVQLGRETPGRPRTDLILALPRPIMLKRVLAQAAALGVDRIFLINAKRVEKSFFKASLLQDEAYQPYLLHGLEQAMDTRVPRLTIHKRFRPFVEDDLPGLMETTNVKLVAHPTAPGGLDLLVRPPGQARVALAIGPEGGWLDFEIDKLKEQGFQPFTLGERILRVDTAVPVTLGQLDLLRRFSP